MTKLEQARKKINEIDEKYEYYSKNAYNFFSKTNNLNTMKKLLKRNEYID